MFPLTSLQACQDTTMIVMFTVKISLCRRQMDGDSDKITSEFHALLDNGTHLASTL